MDQTTHSPAFSSGHLLWDNWAISVKGHREEGHVCAAWTETLTSAMTAACRRARSLVTAHGRGM